MPTGVFVSISFEEFPRNDDDDDDDDDDDGDVLCLFCVVRPSV